MVCTNKAQIPACHLNVDGTGIEQRDSLKYLGSWITSYGRSNMDIKCIIGMAKSAFVEVKNIFCASSQS